MEIDQPYLFVEINDKNFNFLVVKYDENFDFKIVHSETVKSEGISDGKVIDLLNISKIIKEILNLIENKISFLDIAGIVEDVLSVAHFKEPKTIEDIVNIDLEGRKIAENMVNCKNSVI